ncbi:MAG: hypothetical protein D8B54_00450 [Catonella sp.]|nr:MAG: hypothetical protein D8B54_00450 [Catonella sp.]
MTDRLKRYAVGQKLYTDSPLLEYLQQDNIPTNVVVQAFDTLLANYQDDLVDQLVDHPADYLIRQHPVAFLGQADGHIQAQGEIDDRVLDVFQHLHHQAPQEVVEAHIRNSMAVISPEREIDEVLVTLSESVQRLKAQAEVQRQQILHPEILNKPVVDDIEVGEAVAGTELIVDSEYEVETPEVVEPYEADDSDVEPYDEDLVEAVEEPTDSENQAQEQVATQSDPALDLAEMVRRKKEEVANATEPVPYSILQDIELVNDTSDLPVIDSSQVMTFDEEEDVPTESKDTTTEILKESYNYLVEEVKRLELDKLVQFDVPLTLAL